MNREQLRAEINALREKFDTDYGPCYPKINDKEGWRAYGRMEALCWVYESMDYLSLFDRIGHKHGLRGILDCEHPECVKLRQTIFSLSVKGLLRIKATAEDLRKLAR